MRLEAWAGMYNEFLASGKTVKAWCEETGIARTAFHNRLRKVREEALDPKHEIVAVKNAALRKNLCKNESCSKKRCLSDQPKQADPFLQYIPNTVLCQDSIANYPDAMERSGMKSG